MKWRRTGCWRSNERVTFRHPLVRSAVYRSATVARAAGGPSRVGGGNRPGASTRTAGHGTWLRQRQGPTSRLPLELERSAVRAQARGGLAAAAAFLQRAVALTGGPRLDVWTEPSRPPKRASRRGYSRQHIGLVATAEAGSAR